MYDAPDGSVWIENLSTEELRKLQGHTMGGWIGRFSRTGKWLATGGGDAESILWDVETGNRLQTFSHADEGSGHYRGRGHFKGLEVDEARNELFTDYWDGISPDENEATILTASEDGTIRLWSRRTGDELCRLLALPSGDWLVAEYSSGRFDASSLEKIDGLRWVFPDSPYRAYSPELLMRDYYEPRLLPRLLAGDELPELPGVVELNRIQPDVRIVSVDEGKSPDVVVVTVETEPRRDESQKNGKTYTEVYDLRLYREGQLVGQRPWPDTSLRLSNTVRQAGELQKWKDSSKVRKPSEPFEVRLPTHGDRQQIRFSAYAFNEDRVKSTTHYRDFRVPERLEPGPRQAYVIVVGVGVKQRSLRGGVFEPLYYPGLSARKMAHVIARLLADSEDFEKDEIVTVPLISDAYGEHDDDILPTKANVEAVLTLLAGDGVILSGKNRSPAGPIGNLRAGIQDRLFAGIGFVTHAQPQRRTVPHLQDERLLHAVCTPTNDNPDILPPLFRLQRPDGIAGVLQGGKWRLDSSGGLVRPVWSHVVTQLPMSN